MPRASPSQNLLNFQLECNRNFLETAQSQPKSESHRCSFRIELEHELCQSTQHAKPMSSTGNGDKNRLQDKSLPMSIKPASEAYVKYGQRRREQVIR